MRTTSLALFGYGPLVYASWLSDHMKAINDEIGVAQHDFTEARHKFEQKDPFERAYSHVKQWAGNNLESGICIVKHCTKQVTRCGLDETCRKYGECKAGCGINDTQCQVTCSWTYDDAAIDDMVSCLFVDHGCLVLPDPDPLNDATCREPANVVSGLTVDTLEGEWEVYAGFNPEYDCFACQRNFFDSETDENGDRTWQYKAKFQFLNSNGKMQWSQAEMTGSETPQGVLAMAGETGGLPNPQQWYIMYQSESTVLAYYCSQVLTWQSEGLLILSNVTGVDETDLANILPLIDSLGLSYDRDMCKLQPDQDCPVDNWWYEEFGENFAHSDDEEDSEDSDSEEEAEEAVDVDSDASDDSNDSEDGEVSGDENKGEEDSDEDDDSQEEEMELEGNPEKKFDEKKLIMQ